MTIDLLIRVSILVLHTIVQHETAIVHWYWWLEPGHNVLQTSALVILVVTIVDFLWLYFLFYLVGKLFTFLKRFRWINRARAKLRKLVFIEKLFGFFGNNASENPPAAGRSTRMKHALENLGYTGILIIGIVPLPSFKELGIALSFTPRFRKHGFLFMFLGGVIKTLGTILFYLGVDRIIRAF